MLKTYNDNPCGNVRGLSLALTVYISPVCSWHSASHVTMSCGHLICVKSPGPGPEMAVTSWPGSWPDEGKLNKMDQTSNHWLTDGDRPSLASTLTHPLPTGQREEFKFQRSLLNNKTTLLCLGDHVFSKIHNGHSLIESCLWCLDIWPGSICSRIMVKDESQYLLLFVACVGVVRVSLQWR